MEKRTSNIPPPPTKPQPAPPKSSSSTNAASPSPSPSPSRPRSFFDFKSKKQTVLALTLLVASIIVSSTFLLRSSNSRSHYMHRRIGSGAGAGAAFGTFFDLPLPAGNYYSPVVTNRNPLLGFNQDRVLDWSKHKVYGFMVLPFNPPVFMALPYDPPQHHSSWILSNMNGEEPLHYLFMYELAQFAKDYPGAPCQVLDLGANYGVWSLVAGSMGCNVLAAEPADNIAAALALSVRMNNLEGSVKVQRRAVLRDSRETQSVGGDFLDGGAAYVKRGDNPGSENSIPKPTPVVGQVFADEPLWTSTVSEFLDMDPLSVSPSKPLLLLKIDVEGCDLEALTSALPFFKDRSILNAFSEVGPPDWWKRCAGGSELYSINVVDLYKTIIEAGYQLRLITPLNIGVRSISNPGGGLPPGRSRLPSSRTNDDTLYGSKGYLPDPILQGDIPEYSVIESSDLTEFFHNVFSGSYSPDNKAGGAQAEIWFKRVSLSSE